MTAALLQMADAVVDIVLRLPHLPSAGEDVPARAWSTTAGGGFNAMLAARRSGLAVRYGGYLGGGPNGAIIRRALEAEGIEILRAADPSGDQSSCLVMVEDDGERSFVSSPERDGASDQEALSAIRPEPGDMVLIDGYGFAYARSREPMLRWLARCPGDAEVVFDPASAVDRIPPDALDQVLARTDWLSLNAAEATSITGAAAPEQAATLLLEERCPSAFGVILRRGAQGCLVAERGAEVLEVPGFAVEAVDTTGAGDAHIGAFIALRAEGACPIDAARFANAAAALSITRRGPATAPDRADIDRLLRL